MRWRATAFNLATIGGGPPAASTNLAGPRVCLRVSPPLLSLPLACRQPIANYLMASPFLAPQTVDMRPPCRCLSAVVANSTYPVLLAQ